MKILWVSASAIGPAARILNEKYQGTSGGWIQTVYNELNGKNDMFFLCFSKDIKGNRYISKSNDEGTVFCLREPSIHYGVKAPKEIKQSVERIINSISPDIIHIWGTETCVQNMIADCCDNIPKVTFIQGLIGVHERYHGGYLKQIGLKIKMSPIDYVRTIIKNILFKKQVPHEKRQLIKCKNVIGDSAFISSYCNSISQEIVVYNYHLNPSTVFAEKEWKIDSCNRSTIFTVYGGGPDKGLQHLLIALSIVKKTIPNVILHIPGGYHTINGKLAFKNLTPFEKLLKNIIKKLNLEDNVVFDGKLNPEQMAESIRKANVFVNPSIMEVHASSLREAMIIGAPCISSVCGSVIEYAFNMNNSLLYRYEEPEVLAYDLLLLLNNDDLSSRIGQAARKDMLLLSNNKTSLIDIYNEIISKS